MGDDDRLALYRSELGPLRAEINSTLDKMNANENFCAGACAAILAFGVSNQPGWLVFMVLPFATLIAAFGFVRYLYLRRHSHVLDFYLRTIEERLALGGGWASYYHMKHAHDRFGGYSTTRMLYWGSLVAFSLVDLVLTAAGLMHKT